VKIKIIISGDFLRRQQYQSGGAGGISRNQMHSQSHVFGGNQYHGANTYGGGGAYSHFQSGSNSSGSLLFGHHHNSSAQSASVAQVQNGQVRNLRIVDLPFYNVRSVSFKHVCMHFGKGAYITNDL
jgi:hypothetical protein